MDDLFNSLIEYLSLLVEVEHDTIKPYQELVFRIGTIETAICKHMHKEEKQVFPMVIQHFTRDEQSSLVWQFICSVPIGLLEDLFPWAASFLSPNEKVDVRNCMQVIVPNEIPLQEVVLSWFDNNIVEGNTKLGQENKIWRPAPENDRPKLYLTGSIAGWRNAFDMKNVTNDSLSVHIWHGAILQDLNEILVELYRARALDSFSSVASSIIQLKFLADIVIFYRNTLDKLVYPIMDGVAQGCLDVTKRLFNISDIESLQRSLYCNITKGMTVNKFVERICWEVDSFLKVISTHFVFLEMEVLPLIGKVCSYDTQQAVLYASLHMMPLGLLKCTTIWFMTHLSETESKSILRFIQQGATVLTETFASLLNGWVRTGCSGKSSIETFRKDLHEMFSCRCSFITELTEEITGSSSLKSNVQSCDKPWPMPVHSTHSGNSNELAPISSPFSFSISEKYSTLYSSGINMRIFSPRILKTLCPFPDFLSDTIDLSALSNNELRPMDYLFYFHKALKKDLNYLAHKVAELAECNGSLVDFIRRFNRVKFLYQLHSEAEDEIAFPALEAKGKKVENISCSYTIDHKLEADHFNMISELIDEISPLVKSSSDSGMSITDAESLKYQYLCSKLHDMCRCMNRVLVDHIDREEVELWPLFRECFSTEEQEKIVGFMLGRLNAEILQQMIPWLMASLTPEEQKALILIWRRATKNTKFDEWLRAWWEGISNYEETQSDVGSNMVQASSIDPLEECSVYLSKQGLNDGGKQKTACACGEQNSTCENGEILEDGMVDDRGQYHDSSVIDNSEPHVESEHRGGDNAVDVIGKHKESGELLDVKLKCSHHERLLTMSQEELQIVIRKISRDSSLDSKKKSFMMQNLLMSRWIATQRSQCEDASSKEGEFPGQCPSYHDPFIPTFGCKHYRRNCKLLAACCNQLYPCIRCHDEEADHTIDRETITQMMCMQCLVIQPVGPTCSTKSCNSFSMGKYYCSICKLFDDGREIYHCPYCNLCRLGRGLGIDFFHCMNCNACMSRSLSNHICREKCFEDNCPICHEYIFTSSSPVKALPCGHLMHSSCFKDYTCAHYTCPICSKSLGDMQVYFGMLDAMLAEEKIPDEYANMTQVILCNDCGERATTPYHWMYHKCPSCGSYNTRLL
uniref:Zinc finger protein n=1 Tax=Kalanchoe fedtschenkoi TaxID=63787 RepID=A0A7N1A4D0_KALFE